MQHTPIDDAELSEGAKKALVAGPMRLMAARGLAPIPDPGDMVTVLYQLTVSGDANLTSAARKTISDLPDNIIDGALAKNLDERVIDFVAQHDLPPALLEKVIFHPNTHGDTVAGIAEKADSKTIGLIATNEKLILQHPAIIVSMYQNRNAPTALLDRVIELAVRNDVKADLPMWDEIVASLERKDESPADVDIDKELANDPACNAAAPQETEQVEVQIRDMSISQKIRLATLGNSFARAELIRDSKKMVAMAVIKSPAVSETEALKYAKSQGIMEDVIKYIASRREWTKSYQMKLALVQNPKTPFRQMLTFMKFLRPNDLKQISKSKGVPGAVSVQAKKLLKARRK